MRAILTSFGTEGAITPFVTLASALLSRGHQVSLLTNHRHCERFAGLGCELVPLDTAQEYRAFIEDGYLLSTPDRVPEMFRRYYLPKLLPELALIKKRTAAATPCVIVASETPGIAARLAAESLRVPLVSVLVQPNHLSTQEIYKGLIGSVLEPEINSCRRALGLAPRADLRAWWDELDRYLALWPSWFAPEFSGWARTTYAGLLGYKSGGVAPSWFTGQGVRPSILITGGTAHLAGRAFFAASCAALSGVAESAVLLCSQPEILPSHLPSALKVVPWVDSFSAAVREVDVLIHHGGMGTISQALAVGTPQLVLADGGDRPENGRFIEGLGVGRFLPRPQWTAENIRAAVAAIVGSLDIRARCAELASCCDGPAATATAVQVVEAVAAVPGRSDARAASLLAPPADPSRALLARLEALPADKRLLLRTRFHQAAAKLQQS